MSFAQDVKNEIVQKRVNRTCCAQSVSYGIACFSKYFGEEGLIMQTESQAVAQYAKKIFHYAGISGEIVVGQRGNSPLYEFRVEDPEQIAIMLDMFQYSPEQASLRVNPALVRCSNCVGAFLSGAFVCCGTMTGPEKEYNLEFLSNRHNLAKDLEGVLAEHEFRPHRTVRKGVNVVYIKSSEQIEDLLTFMGAGNAAMQIMDYKVIKELRNKTNRLTNCETANMDKTAVAMVQAIKAIHYLQEQGAFEALTPALQQTAMLRLKWPHLPLAKLALESPEPISKSGLSHRLRKLQQIAEDLRQRNENVGVKP